MLALFPFIAVVPEEERLVRKFEQRIFLSISMKAALTLPPGEIPRKGRRVENRSTEGRQAPDHAERST